MSDVDEFGAEESGRPRQVRLASGESELALAKLTLAGAPAGDESVLPPPTSPASRVGAGGRPGSGESGPSVDVPRADGEGHEVDARDDHQEPQDLQEERGAEGLDTKGSDAEESGLALSLVQSAIAGAIQNMASFGMFPSAQTAPPATASRSDGEAKRAAPASPPTSAARQSPMKLSEQSPSHLGALQEDNEEPES